MFVILTDLQEVADQGQAELPDLCCSAQVQDIEKACRDEKFKINHTAVSDRSLGPPPNTLEDAVDACKKIRDFDPETVLQQYSNVPTQLHKTALAVVPFEFGPTPEQDEIADKRPEVAL